jgi:gamma-glutamyltranspeptidase/glutathione hydrolase
MIIPAMAPAAVRRRGLHVLAVLGCLAVALPAWGQARPQPEGPSGFTEKRAALGTRFMAAAAHPVAAAAGRDVLRMGGSAVDAAIAIQMVLNVVEPQSSGIGGGGFLVHYDASTKQITTYDGREAAPASATPDLFLDAEGKPIPFKEAAVGGIAVGTPGLLRMLDMAHRNHGRINWSRLFEPAMRIANDGFQVSPRLNKLITQEPQLKEYPATAAYFYDQDGNPRAVGAHLVNAPLAETLRTIAVGGADAFYNGSIARDVVAAVQSTGARPGGLTLEDLSGYRAVQREPVCGLYRVYRVCGMGPPSSGGIAVIEALGVLDRFGIKGFAPNSVGAVHLITEASRLAFADRNRYVADADYVDVPIKGLIEPRYLRQRARLISLEQSMGKAEPGRPEGVSIDLGPRREDSTRELPGTTHIAVVDAAGNAVALTSSIENAFGSRVFVRGFLLNNQLTDFAFTPREGDRSAANRVEPGKRPRSSMAPTIVTDRQGQLVLTVGSPGGSRIIPYVVKTLVATLDWGLDIQAAMNLPHHANLNGPIELERGTPIAAIAPELRALGHAVEARELTSGLHGIAVIRRGESVQLLGGADPRREGEAMGE